MHTHILNNRPTEVIPLPEPIIGVRLFNIDRNRLLLQSLAIRKADYWLPGEIKESVCNNSPKHGHIEPVADCSCGIWSCTSRRGLIQSFPASVLFQKNTDDNYFGYWSSYVPYICARIEQWGIVIKHEWGYRSQYARIIPESICWWPRSYGRTQTKLLDHIREKYSDKLQRS